MYDELGLGKKWPWPISRYYPGNLPKMTDKNHEKPCSG